MTLAAAAWGAWAHAQQAPSAGAPAAQAVLDRVNHYRGLAGVPKLTADPTLHAAAQAHTQYMAEVGQLGHAQSERTSPHYTGDTLEERLRRAGATFSRTGEAVGLANRDDPAAVVDDLMSTIYHRLLLLASDFESGGAGAARGNVDGMEVVFVAIDLAAAGSPPTASPIVTTYPANLQEGVPADFDPASETPNPMPELELVGQPVTVQATQDAPLVVDRFRLVMAGSSEAVDAKLLTRSNDMQMPEGAAALIPLQPLQPATGYQASFSGSIAGAAVERTWRFRTAATRSVSMSFARAVVDPGGVQTVRLRNVDPTRGNYFICYEPLELVRDTAQESFSRFTLSVNRCAEGSSCTVVLRAAYDRACERPFARGSFRIGG